MANNYTTSAPTTIELSGDSVAAGTILPAYDIIITPNSGYVIQASDFSIGSTLPLEVTGVAFSDTTTALDPSNQVKATVTLAQWYTMPSNSDTIEVDIDGSTHLANARFNYKAVYVAQSNLVETFNVPTVTSPLLSSKSTSTSGSTVTETCFVDMPVNTTNVVAQATFTCDSGYYFAAGSVPTYVISSPDLSKWTSATISTTTNSSNDITSISFEFSYDISNIDVPLSQGESIRFLTKQPTADPVVVKSISYVTFNHSKNNSIISAKVDSVDLIINGSNTAAYQLKVENNIGQTYDFNTNTFTRSLTTINDKIGPASFSRKFTNNVTKNNLNTHNLILPTFSEKTFYNQYWVATVTPLSTTYTTADGSSQDPITATLYRFGEVDFQLSTNASTYGVNASTTTIKSLEDQKPLSYPTQFNPTDFPLLSTDNNGYFTYSSPLSYRVDATVGSNWSSGNLTMAAGSGYVDKKIQVGDTLSHANIAADTVVTAVNVGSNVLVYTISKSPSSQVDADQVITFTRTVGISRQPLASDIDITAPLAITSGIPSNRVYSVAQSTSNSPIVNLHDYSGTNNFSNVIVGLTVSGDFIDGYPKVLSQTGGSVVMSSNQTLPVGTRITFSPVLSSIWIDNIAVTGAGTSTCKLLVDGYIERMGYEDVTARLTLQNFITTYASPTTVAIDLKDDLGLTCAVGGSVKIDPRSLCTTHTGALTVATAPRGSGAGTTVVSNSGEYLIYQAPSSDADLSDVITYTVSDGINTSNTSNITITLTL